MRFKKAMNRLRFYSGFLLLGFYLTVGVVFLFTEVWADLVPKGRFFIGSLLILFGSLRFYVGYRRYISRSFRLKEKENAKKTE